MANRVLSVLFLLDSHKEGIFYMWEAGIPEKVLANKMQCGCWRMGYSHDPKDHPPDNTLVTKGKYHSKMERCGWQKTPKPSAQTLQHQQWDKLIFSVFWYDATGNNINYGVFLTKMFNLNLIMRNIRKIQIVEHSTRQLVRIPKHQCHQRFKKKKKRQGRRLFQTEGD